MSEEIFYMVRFHTGEVRGPYKSLRGVKAMLTQIRFARKYPPLVVRTRRFYEDESEYVRLEEALAAPLGRESMKGSDNPKAKLHESDIPSIREKLKTQSVRSIAREYGVGHKAIRDIKHGRRWTHVR